MLITAAFGPRSSRNTVTMFVRTSHATEPSVNGPLFAHQRTLSDLHRCEMEAVTGTWLLVGRGNCRWLKSGAGYPLCGAFRGAPWRNPTSHLSPSTMISLAIFRYSSLTWPAATNASTSAAVIVHARVWLLQRARGHASRRTSTNCGFHANRTTGIWIAIRLFGESAVATTALPGVARRRSQCLHTPDMECAYRRSPRPWISSARGRQSCCPCIAGTRGPAPPTEVWIARGSESGHPCSLRRKAERDIRRNERFSA